MKEASPLGLVAAQMRAHLPPGVDAGYLDGFIDRHRDALVAQLRPVSAREESADHGDLARRNPMPL